MYPCHDKSTNLENQIKNIKQRKNNELSNIYCISTAE